MAQTSVLDYIRHTPNNSNVNVVKGMLNSAGSGGNPNRIQTIQGTLAEPFGEVDADELLEALQTNEATIMMETYFLVDQSSYHFMGYMYPYYPSLMFDSCNFFRADFQMALHVVWGPNVGDSLIIAVIRDGAESIDLMDRADEIETEMTIIWHPMPE